MKKIRSYMSRTFEFDKFVVDQYRLIVDISVSTFIVHIDFASMLFPFEEILSKKIKEKLKNELDGRALVLCFNSEIPLSYFDYKEFEKILAPEN